MKRRNLLKGLGVIGLGSVLPLSKSENALSKAICALNNENSGCWLTPQKTEGPYYFNANLIRQDITEGRPGMPVHMTINVINATCSPIPNVLVDIWHCDKDGVYSGYGPTVGQTFMRGIQITNSNGVAVFDTIHPGWYPGRATHIHFKVRLTASTFVTSQFCYLDSINNTIYNTPLYIARGPNPTSNAADPIFGSSNPQYLVMTYTPNATGYDGTYTIGINSPTGINDPNIETNGFILEQNYPNPFNPSTTITYHLPIASDVKLIVYDVLGIEVATLVDEKQSAGKYTLNFNANKLSSGFYFYKLIAGNFVETKEMLLLK